MRVLSTLGWLLVVAAAEAGYYKVRPPPPPPPSPGSLHYGPHPPMSRYPRPGSHYPPPPPYHRYSSPSRLPLAATSPVKAGSVRHYTRYPPPPPPHHKPVYSPWKNGYNAFRAPVLKESFAPQHPSVSPPETSYSPSFLTEDDDKGPIHTIPAPNLGPQDKPANLFQLDGFQHQKKPLHSTEEDLAAVLKHGLTKVNIHHNYNSGYQVTEDPSLHQPHTGSASFFAPDPSPDLPNIQLPPTNDPHSLPSNGQVPLDLYLQQEAEKHHHSEDDSSNHLTAQDLFNLLNYNPSNSVGLIPQAQLQQHVLQPNVQFYNQGLLMPQSQHLDAAASQNILAQQAVSHNVLAQAASHNLLAQTANHNDLLAHQAIGHNALAQQAIHSFAPQFQTFNYDEQTQQGAHGSDIFPASSMNLDLSTKHHLPSFNVASRGNLEDNDVEGSERHETYEKVEENEVAQQPIESRKLAPTKDIPISTKSYAPNHLTVSGEAVNRFTVTGGNSHPVALPPQDNISETQNAANHQEKTQSTPNGNTSKKEQQPQNKQSGKPEENVQLQKSIQIYENTYTSSGDNLMNQEIKNLNDYADDYTEEEKIVKEMAIGQPLETSEQTKEKVHFVDAVPYGARIRPKRF